jgi:signal transduction histidine kinase
VNSAVDVLDERILLLAPSGKDAALAAEVFRREGLCSRVCEELIELADELRRGAGVLLLAHEALLPRELPALVEALRRQPAWSDIPVLILTRGRNPQEDMRLVQSFAPAGNVTLMERPLSTLGLTTTVQSALRTRRRQYQVRDLLEEQKETAEVMRTSQQEILKLNVELEQRVAHRTAELRAVNQELEAFCYSVSHDLRAPLRAIDGFALTVLEHCNGSLDATAREYLERARGAAQRLQRLIDDLLGLSRLSRTEMKVERVNLSAMAEAIVRELTQTQTERREVEVIIAPEIFVQGDAALLEIALRNLLGNAWKFTSKRARAVIEFGVQSVNGAPAIFVRDNGAGFDMTYASKLFAPFQRLHTGHDFPGSGIGLAIVMRVIRRHNGEVWAEGRRDQGASVYFRLPGLIEGERASLVNAVATDSGC